MIFENIDDFLDNNNDHLICFTVSTYNNLNLIRNLIISAQNNNIKIVFFALDKNISKFIDENFNIDVVLYLVNDSLNKNFHNFEFGSKEWCNMVYDRYFITHRLLKDGRNIVYMDTDVYINRNFIIDIKNKLRSNDILIQSNDHNCCTGFYAMKSCKKLINFFNRKNMVNNLKCYEFGGDGGTSDQKFFNHYIGKDINTRKEYNCILLERNFYPNGNYYFDNNELINEYCYIIHFNCIRGEYNKILNIIKYNKLIVELIDYIPNDLEDDNKDYKKLIKSLNKNSSNNKNNNSSNNKNYKLNNKKFEKNEDMNTCEIINVDKNLSNDVNEKELNNNENIILNMPVISDMKLNEK